MRKILITGAHGFIGRYAAKFFSGMGWHVTGIDLTSWDEGEKGLWGITDWHTSDITLDNLMSYAGKPDLIIHCAGSGTVGFSMTHPYEDYKMNVDTTMSILEFARLHAPEARILYPSSAAVYGAANRIPIDELVEPNPITPYGVHKKSAEDLCRSYAHYFGLSVAIIRLFSIYGIGLRKQLLWDACLKIHNHENSFWGTGFETRDWVHVEDAVALFNKTAIHASSQCPVVNCGSGLGVPICDILSEIFRCFGRTDSTTFSGTSRSGDPLHYVADISLARMWGWKPERDWRQGIREYVEWFKANVR
jgi:UDP-glucose 4-epimerase